MKFKVGDKVRVREDLEVDKDYGDYCIVVEDMKEYKGKEFIIHEVLRDCYRLKDIGYYWTDEMLEPTEREKNNMNIEELNLEYKTKMDALMEEYKTKVKEVTKKEELFIEEEQEYCFIDSTGDIYNNIWTNHPIDQQRLDFGNCFPYTEENKEEVRKEVELIAERIKLQSEMEMFARQNNEEEIDWNNSEQRKWFLYIYSDGIITEYVNNYRDFNTTYFTSKEVAKKALDKFSDRIKELYLDVEE